MEFLRNKAHTWYAEQVLIQISGGGIALDRVSNDLKIRILKPLHPVWVT